MSKYLNAGSSGQWGWHATELALRCPQLFAYHHRIHPPGLTGDRAALTRGSLVHAGLAHHYARVRSTQQGLDPEEWLTPLEAITRCAEELCLEQKSQEPMSFIPTAQTIVSEYAAHWAHESSTVLHVEEVFGADIAGYRFTQRFDLVLQRPDGTVWVLDHKTTGRIDSKVPTRYTLSGQFLGMAMFGRKVWGEKFGGVLLNLIGCGDVRGSVKSGSCTFSREEVNPAPHALRLFPLSVKHARERIEALDASGVDPWEWPKTLSEQTCVTAYGRCDGYELCRWGNP